MSRTYADTYSTRITERQAGELSEEMARQIELVDGLTLRAAAADDAVRTAIADMVIAEPHQRRALALRAADLGDAARELRAMLAAAIDREHVLDRECLHYGL